jgi:hypothetical protein
MRYQSYQRKAVVITPAKISTSNSQTPGCDPPSVCRTATSKATPQMMRLTPSSHRFANFAELRTAFEQWAIQKGWSSLIPPVMTRVELEAAMTADDWVNRGYALGMIGKHEECYQSYLRALDLNPKLRGVHISIGSALIRLGASMKVCNIIKDRPTLPRPCQ